jgi:murein DD-endopeptidase MepM/ murein hydrolase activator NlpD
MSRKVTLMIIPEGGDKVFSRSLSSSLFKALLVILSVWLIFLFGITIIYSRMAAKAARSAMLESENHRLREYFSRVVDIEKSFKKNQELTARLAEMAGIKLEESGQPEINFDSLSSEPIKSPAATAILDSLASRVAMTAEQLEQERLPRGMPLYGWITKPFQPESDKDTERHTGIDLAVKEGTSVTATASGAVLFAGWDENLGNLVVIDHGNGYLTSYGHNKKMLVVKGQKVLKGDTIALSGNTGHSSAPHLHYEIMKDGVPVDPAPFLE